MQWTLLNFSKVCTSGGGPQKTDCTALYCSEHCTVIQYCSEHFTVLQYFSEHYNAVLQYRRETTQARVHCPLHYSQGCE